MRRLFRKRGLRGPTVLPPGGQAQAAAEAGPEAPLGAEKAAAPGSGLGYGGQAGALPAAGVDGADTGATKELGTLGYFPRSH